MTVLLIRKIAKELAGQFYEEADGGKFGGDKADRERSSRFRDTFPTQRDHLRGWQRCQAGFTPPLGSDGLQVDKRYFRVQGSDRWWKLGTPGWHYFVEIARLRCVEMLSDKSISAHEKNAIAEALIEENERATAPAAQSLLQRRVAGKVQVN